MRDYIRVFRHKEIDFSEVMMLLHNNDRIKAKIAIDQLFRHLTNVKVGYGILKLIEENSEVPNNNVILSYIEGLENKEAKRRLHTTITKNDVKKAEQEFTKDNILECNLPKCPTCGSTQLTKKGIGSRAIDGFFFGKLSVEGRSQFICQSCGYQW